MIRLEHAPLKNNYITSEFGLRNLLGMWWHNGIDLRAVEGTPVYAVASGIVQVAKDNPTGYGLYIVVEHTNFSSLSAHLSKMLVKVGQGVKTGDIIGYSGNTGTSTAPHLHFEIRECGFKDFWTRCACDSQVFMRCVDPTPYLEALQDRIDIVTVDKAVSVIKETTGFEDKTIDYLVNDYRYGNELALKLAKALK